MGLPQEKELRYTYYDYVSWPDDERWELIDGEAYAMTPAPKTRHQSIIVQLARNVAGGVQSSGCRLFVAPTDVVFDVDNVVQPDVFVVCDPGRITADNIQGAPDLIIEVLSASTEFRDKREKKRLYEKFGVMEYLLVYPEREYVERYFLENGRYGAPELINWDESLLLRVVAVKVNLWEIFEREKRQG